jgi:tRNA isopentenyl-2-thiomethyl-A-37 hydroxylase MiaE
LKSKYPILAPDRRRVLLEIKEDLHSFNQFKDIIHNTNVPVWKLDCTNVFRNLNNSVLDYNSRRLSSNPLRSTQNKVRLIQDRDYQYQFIFKGLFLNDGESRRF